MGRMSDLDLQNREEIPDYSYEDPWSFCEEGEHAYLSGSKNPYKPHTYAWAEWERGYIETSKRESRDERD
jgi:hypothetical protein